MPNRERYEAVGYLYRDGDHYVVFECRCCGTLHDFDVTQSAWLA
jgi:hypothetical protein